ncbi:hypothetical protein VTI74DRAFT_11518 [Chaetomium olivicolor]
MVLSTYPRAAPPQLRYTLSAAGIAGTGLALRLRCLAQANVCADKRPSYRYVEDKTLLLRLSVLGFDAAPSCRMSTHKTNLVRHSDSLLPLRPPPACHVPRPRSVSRFALKLAEQATSSRLWIRNLNPASHESALSVSLGYKVLLVPPLSSCVYLHTPPALTYIASS